MIKDITISLNTYQKDASGNTITISTEYKVKRTNRALMFWENYTKKSLDELSGTLTDILTAFYCILFKENENFTYSFDEFLDISDDNPKAFEKFKSYLIELNLEMLNDDDDQTKKKVTEKPI